MENKTFIKPAIEMSEGDGVDAVVAGGAGQAHADVPLVEVECRSPSGVDDIDGCAEGNRAALGDGADPPDRPAVGRQVGVVQRRSAPGIQGHTALRRIASQVLAPARTGR